IAAAVAAAIAATVATAIAAAVVAAIATTAAAAPFGALSAFGARASRVRRSRVGVAAVVPALKDPRRRSVADRRSRERRAHPNLCGRENFRAIQCDAAGRKVLFRQWAALCSSHTLSLYCLRASRNNNGCYRCGGEYEKRSQYRSVNLFHFFIPIEITLEK
ncbi:MAG TPA: hypothetical protein VD840_12385, partial [Sinorhizobium sp.]|nr:hypothetical protein [Sinorhizobium sp.]